MLYSLKILHNTGDLNQKKPFKKAFFVAKKKIFKKANDRNRVKRRIKSAFVDVLKESNNNCFLKSDKKIIFFIERDMISSVYSDIVQKMKKDIQEIIHKYNLNNQ